MYVFSPNTGKYGPEKTSYLDTYGVNLRIQFKYRKIQTKKNLDLDTVNAVLESCDIFY